MPSAAPPSPRKSPGWSPSSRRTGRATPPATSLPSTAAAPAGAARCKRGSCNSNRHPRLRREDDPKLRGRRLKAWLTWVRPPFPATTAPCRSASAPSWSVPGHCFRASRRACRRRPRHGARRFGGLQGRFSLFSRIVEELTFGCASSAWVYAVLAEHQWIIAQYPEQAQLDVWGGDPLAVASSSLAPRAAAAKTAGGWRLSGKFPFSSGCDHAQWGIVGAFLGASGDARHVAYLLVPLAETEIIDDWQVLGLAGTGSKSLVLKDVFVPGHRCVMVGDLFAGTPPGAGVHPDYPVVRAPRGFLVSYSLPPVAIALGRRALDLVCRDLATRVSRGVSKMADSEVVQMAIGEAAAAIDAATLSLHHGRDASSDAVDSGRRIGMDEALRARRDMVYA